VVNWLLRAMVLLLASTGLQANSNGAKGAAADDLKQAAQALKGDILALTQQLNELEESLLYPPDVRFGVFLSLNEKTRFKLDSIELFVDDALVSTYLYQDSDIRSLLNGGIQQLYLGSVPPGEHKLTASFNGQGRSGGYFKRKKSLKFEKNNEARYIQLLVSETPGAGEPVFKVKQW